MEKKRTIDVAIATRKRMGCFFSSVGLSLSEAEYTMDALRVVRPCLFGKVLLMYIEITDQIPLPFVDQIIHHLHNDPGKSLDACALTGRNWLPSANSLKPRPDF